MFKMPNRAGKIRALLVSRGRSRRRCCVRHPRPSPARHWSCPGAADGNQRRFAVPYARRAAVLAITPSLRHADMRSPRRLLSSDPRIPTMPKGP
jgi:hypothetical protein